MIIKLIHIGKTDAVFKTASGNADLFSMRSSKSNSKTAVCRDVLIWGTLLFSLTGCPGNDTFLSPSTTTTLPASTTTTTLGTTTTTTSSTTTSTTTTTLAAWTATAGSLSAGSWQNAASDPDATHVGAYGGLDYAPNGDLYLFYDTGVFPNDTMYGKIRRSGGSTWTSASTVTTREHSAHAYFDGTGKPYVATEDAGSVWIWSSTNYGTATPTWNWLDYYPVNASNTSGRYPFGNAFITYDGSNFGLYYTYLYYNVVFGSSSWGLQAILQTNGAWPADGTMGTSIDGADQVNFDMYPHGASGAYVDSTGKVLALSNEAFRSTDHGANFSRVQNTSDVTTSLAGISGSCQNSTDSSVVFANLYQNGFATAWSLSVWGTRDLGQTFSKITTTANIGTPYRAEVSCIQNLIMVAYTTDGGSGESQLWTMWSSDGGVTWTTPALLVDATTGGHSDYTFASLRLTANANNGSIALMYSLVSGTTPKGIYIKEFQ